jgi:hypothetical protein
MCFAEFLDELARQGIDLTEMQVRYLIRTRKIDRPAKDESGRYRNAPTQIRQLQSLYNERQGAE